MSSCICAYFVSLSPPRICFTDPFDHSCDPILNILDDTILHCQNSATLESAHGLLQTLTSDPKFAAMLTESSPASGRAGGSGGSVLNETLQGMGFGGLWQFCSLNPTREPDKPCFDQTEKLIEVRRE